MQFSPKNGVYMNSKDLQNAALFMGYRRVENRYLKPVGNSCFGINPENGKIACYFKANGEVHVWSSEILEGDTVQEYVSAIKYFEAYKIHQTYEESNFEFVTPEQVVEL